MMRVRVKLRGWILLIAATWMLSKLTVDMLTPDIIQAERKPGIVGEQTTRPNEPERAPERTEDQKATIEPVEPKLEPPGDILTMEATAYTAGPESTGKKLGDPGYGITRSGLPADRGVVAVDPTVIPLGTVVFVEGYGYAIALDTGSAIKGNRIDVFFHDVKKARQWGRKEVTVRIIHKPQKFFVTQHWKYQPPGS